MGMTAKEEAILWLNSFVKNKEPMTLIPKQLIRLMHEALTEQPDIVRCKDCKYWWEKAEECQNPNGDCVIDGWCKPDWFCADGKLKTQDKNSNA